VDRESKSREFRLRPDMVEQASRMMVENGMLYNEISYDDIIAK
jgi:NitT/TauT family transport system substrate-binding protein